MTGARRPNTNSRASGERQHRNNVESLKGKNYYLKDNVKLFMPSDVMAAIEQVLPDFERVHRHYLIQAIDNADEFIDFRGEMSRTHQDIRVLGVDFTPDFFCQVTLSKFKRDSKCNSRHCRVKLTIEKLYDNKRCDGLELANRMSKLKSIATTINARLSLLIKVTDDSERLNIISYLKSWLDNSQHQFQLLKKNMTNLKDTKSELIGVDKASFSHSEQNVSKMIAHYKQVMGKLEKISEQYYAQEMLKSYQVKFKNLQMKIKQFLFRLEQFDCQKTRNDRTQWLRDCINALYAIALQDAKLEEVNQACGGWHDKLRYIQESLHKNYKCYNKIYNYLNENVATLGVDMPPRKKFSFENRQLKFDFANYFLVQAFSAQNIPSLTYDLEKIDKEIQGHDVVKIIPMNQIALLVDVEGTTKKISKDLLDLNNTAVFNLITLQVQQRDINDVAMKREIVAEILELLQSFKSHLQTCWINAHKKLHCTNYLLQIFEHQLIILDTNSEAELWDTQTLLLAFRAVVLVARSTRVLPRWLKYSTTEKQLADLLMDMKSSEDRLFSKFATDTDIYRQAHVENNAITCLSQVCKHVYSQQYPVRTCRGLLNILQQQNTNNHNVGQNAHSILQRLR